MNIAGIAAWAASLLGLKRTGDVRQAYAAFAGLMRADRLCLEHMAVFESACPDGDFTLSFEEMRRLVRGMGEQAEILVKELAVLVPHERRGLAGAFKRAAAPIDDVFRLEPPHAAEPYVVTLAGAAGKQFLAGDKASRLGLAVLAGYCAPPGFVVTANAYQALMEQNDLRGEVETRLAGLSPDDPAGLDTACRRVRSLVRRARLPDALTAAVDRAMSSLRDEAHGRLTLAVRSSALGEDTWSGFSGQYRSLIGVEPENLHMAYKAVVAGKYLARAVALRMRMGLADQEIPMAVLVMPRVRAKTGGVAFSLDPMHAKGREVAKVFTVPGSPKAVVDGDTIPEITVFTRQDPPELVAVCDGHRCMFGEKRHPEPHLSALRQAAGAALSLERRFGHPQEVEWCIGPDDGFRLLQTRDLSPVVEESRAEEAPLGLVALHRGGIQASPGSGCGPAWLLNAPAALADVPHGAILVVRALWPELALVLGRARGVIAETGSQAGHLASVARTLGVPVLAAVENALGRFAAGSPLTLDADARTIYAGLADAARLRRPRKRPLAAPRALARWREAVCALTTLSLTDPDAPDFAPHGVRTLHDLVRYCHETAVRAMFSLGERHGVEKAVLADLDLPLKLSVLDLGGGLGPGGDSPSGLVSPGRFCPPLAALVAGLGRSRSAWDATGPHLDWEMLSLSLEGGVVSAAQAALKAYALVTDNHVHFLARFGYHFAVLDGHAGPLGDQNYLQFSFKGGGGPREGRLARIGLLSWILERQGFAVASKGDLLTARLSRPEAARALANLNLLGFMLGRTTFLDMTPGSDALDRAARDIGRVADELAAPRTENTSVTDTNENAQ